MKIKVSSKSWWTAAHKRSMEKLANHVVGHYPKDSQLHKAVRGCFKAFDKASTKLKKNAKSSPKRRSAKRSTSWRKRRSSVRRRTARRATAKRRTTKRRTARRAAPKRRMKRVRRVRRWA